MGNQPASQANSESNHRQDLGTVIKSFPARYQTLNRVIGISLGCMLILASISFFALRFSDMATGIRAHGRAVILLHAPALIVLLAFLPVGVLVLLITAIHWDNHLTLFEEGLVLRRGRKQKVCEWKQTTRLDTRITHIKFGGSIVDIRIKLLLGNTHDKLVVHNWFEDMSEIVQDVRTTLLPILVEWAKGQFKHKKTIEFHRNLVGNQDSLKIKGEPFGWREFDLPKIKNQKITLYGNQEHNKLFQADLEKIANLDLLVVLLKNL